MKRLLLLSLFIPIFADAAPRFREHDSDSVIVGPFCVPDILGAVIESTMDFDLTSLTITITPNTAIAGFTYTTTGIINVAVPDTWEDPAAGEIGVDKSTVGANNGCVVLHLRDEVLAVADAAEWMVGFSDGGSAIMDWHEPILATLGRTAVREEAAGANVDQRLDHLALVAATDADVEDDTIIAQMTASGATADFTTFDNETDSQQANRDALDVVDTVVDANAVALAAIEVDTGTDLPAQITALNDPTVDEIWNRVCETQGSIQCDQMISLIGAEAFGQAAAPSSGATWTVSTANGVATRIVIVYGTDNGDRTTSTLTP